VAFRKNAAFWPDQRVQRSHDRRCSLTGYYEVPAEVVEDVNHLGPWMKKAIDVAAAAKNFKPKRSKR
jgi:TfoX/Sxy family transcriptional regulator of competence genes